MTKRKIPTIELTDEQVEFVHSQQEKISGMFRAARDAERQRIAAKLKVKSVEFVEENKKRAARKTAPARVTKLAKASRRRDEIRARCRSLLAERPRLGDKKTHVAEVLAGELNPTGRRKGYSVSAIRGHIADLFSDN